jgi:hypothetical protein
MGGYIDAKKKVSDLMTNSKDFAVLLISHFSLESLLLLLLL